MRTIMNEVDVYFHRYCRTVGAIIVAVCLTAAIGACGLKGDLYLPDDKPKDMTPP
jgi:predicted small lipoprotein YifL